MTTFFEGDSNLMTAAAFEFVLDSELKRAVRSQHYLTLVTLQATRETDGSTVTAEESTVQAVAQLIGGELRDSDLIGHTDSGTLTMALLEADFEHAERVIRRMVARIEKHAFPEPLRIAVGAAVYPTHAVDAGSLKRYALARPVAQGRGGPHPPTDQT